MVSTGSRSRGKPLAATAGARIFEQGGNAVDAACAMLAATSTMFDVLSWGGETQALIYHPGERKVIAINALGVAPSGATPEFFRERGYAQPPEYGPLAAVTPGTPGGLLVMLAEYGTLSLADVLAPALRPRTRLSHGGADCRLDRAAQRRDQAVAVVCCAVSDPSGRGAGSAPCR